MKPTQYLVIRHGSNAANQRMRAAAPVAIVTAGSRAAATETVRLDPPGKLDPHSPAVLALDNEITVWANQHLTAVPVSRASKADLRELREELEHWS